MKRGIAIALVGGLLAGALASPSMASRGKGKSVATTLYMHGSSEFGEVEGVQWVAGGGEGEYPRTLDSAKPKGTQPKSTTYSTPVLNVECTGSPFYPTFVGKLSGTLTGDAKMTLHFVSAGSTAGTIRARLWADRDPYKGPPNDGCNETMIVPDAEVEIDVPAGQNTVTAEFTGLNVKVKDFVMLSFVATSGTNWRGQAGRLLYDSSSADSRIEFRCVPAAGRSCVPAAK